jgi:hypothetical protein
MRDPELVARAHRAAVALEQAWERWRTRHGQAGPVPPVSSYVGYSMEEPWGRPRVVFGIDANEAELLAALLDRQEGAAAGRRPPETAPALVPAGERSPVRAVLPEDNRPAGQPRLPEQRGFPSGERHVPQPGPKPSVAPGPVGDDTLTHAPLEHHSVAGAGNGTGGVGSIAAELAGWASGELPGQASARLAAWEAIGGVPVADPRQAALPSIDADEIDKAAEPVR